MKVLLVIIIILMCLGIIQLGMWIIQMRRDTKSRIKELSSNFTYLNHQANLLEDRVRDIEIKK